jgi:hypothetical protein
MQLLHYHPDTMCFGISSSIWPILPSIKLHPARIGFLDTSYDTRQCTFAGTVFTDQSVNLTGPQIKIDRRKRLHTGE